MSAKNNTQFCHYILRGIIVGDSGVGKSSILHYLVNKTFKQLHDLTIGVEFEQVHFTISDKNNEKKEVKLHIWDTAGLETFQAITQIYFQRCCMVFVVYDVGNRSSFTKVPNWINTVKRKCKSHVEIILIGNKSDSIRGVTYSEGLECAQSYGVLFMETSAQNGSNINVIFRRACERIVRYTVEQIPNTLNNGIQRGCLIEPAEFFTAQSDRVVEPGVHRELMNKCCTIM